MKTTIEPKTKTAQQVAQYRVLLKRILRSAELRVESEEATETLEANLKALATHVPEMVSKKVDSQWELAAKAWEDGNNSGNSQTLTDKEKQADDIQTAAVTLMENVFGVTVDFPGLYPSFMVKGYSKHSTLGAIKAALAVV